MTTLPPQPPAPDDTWPPPSAPPELAARFPATRTGSWIRSFAPHVVVETAAAALEPPVPSRPQVAVVVDPDDAGEVARATAALACRRAGRVVVHTTPGLPRQAWRLGFEVLCALGKHYDRYSQRCSVSIGRLCTVWLRAEGVRDLVVLRAHHLGGKALAWLLELPARERLRLWLCAPDPLPELDAALGAAAPRLSPEAFFRAVPPHPAGCGCEDLNQPAPAPAASTSPPPLTPVASRLLRRLHDPEAAALGAAALLLGRPHPGEQAAARVHVTGEARSITTAAGRVRAVPEHARGLLRGWSWRDLLPSDWALDVTETYLVLRLEDAGRHTGLPLLDPAYPQLEPVAWHEREWEPGASLLSWITRSHALAPTRRPIPGSPEWDAEMAQLRAELDAWLAAYEATYGETLEEAHAAILAADAAATAAVEDQERRRPVTGRPVRELPT